jgi:hypothetical protein
MAAAMKAARDVRGGRWLRGAPSHVLAEFLGELERAGWKLSGEEEVAREQVGRRARLAETKGRLQGLAAGLGLMRESAAARPGALDGDDVDRIVAVVEKCVADLEEVERSWTATPS